MEPRAQRECRMSECLLLGKNKSIIRRRFMRAQGPDDSAVLVSLQEPMQRRGGKEPNQQDAEGMQRGCLAWERTRGQADRRFLRVSTAFLHEHRRT